MANYANPFTLIIGLLLSHVASVYGGTTCTGEDFISVDIKCSVNGIDCDSYSPPPSSPCFVDLTYDVIWCNKHGSSFMLFKKKQTKMVLNDTKVIFFNKKKLRAGKCRNQKTTTSVDLCTDRVPPVSSLMLKFKSYLRDDKSQICLTTSDESTKKTFQSFVDKSICDLETSLESCKTDDGTNCEDLYLKKDQCGDIDVELLFKYCNKSSRGPIKLLANPTKARVNGSTSQVTDLAPISPGACKEYTIMSKVSTCPRTFWTSFGAGGWLIPRKNNNYCLDYTYQRFEPYKYIEEPGPDQARITAQISCHLEGDENILCDQMAKYGCGEKPVVYEFKACNRETDDTVDSLWANIKINGKKTAARTIIQKKSLAPNECVTMELKTTINACTDFKAVLNFFANVSDNVTGEPIKIGKDYARYPFFKTIAPTVEVTSPPTTSPTASPTFSTTTSPTFSTTTSPTFSTTTSPTFSTTTSPTFSTTTSPTFSTTASPASSVSPTAVPTPHHTHTPSFLPSSTKEQCVITSEIECAFEDGSSCDSFVNDGLNCKLKTRFTVNFCNGSASQGLRILKKVPDVKDKVTQVILNGKKEDKLYLLPTQYIEPTVCLSASKTIDFDKCKNKPLTASMVLQGELENGELCESSSSFSSSGTPPI